MKRISKLFLLSVVLLSGCHNPMYLGPPARPQHFTSELPAVRAAQLYQLTAYRTSGVFDTIIDGSRRIIGFDWYFSAPNNFTLMLEAPGNMPQAILQDAYGKVTYGRGEGNTIAVDSLHNFMLSQIGWYIPLDRFYYWLRGVPLPANVSAKTFVAQYDRYGHLTALKQGQWILWYSRYIQYGVYDLPTMIDVKDPAGNMTHLVVKDWQPYAGPARSSSSISKKDKQLLRSVS